MHIAGAAIETLPGEAVRIGGTCTPSGVAAGPLVFVVNPGLEADLLSVFDADLYRIPESVGKIRCATFIQTGTSVHVGAVNALFHHLVDLPHQLIRLECSVPCPERLHRIFVRRVFELIL